MRAKFNSDLKDPSITSIAPVYYWKKPESNKSVPYIRWYILDQTEVMYAELAKRHESFEVGSEVEGVL